MFMKSRDIAVRLRRFELTEKRQTVADLETMISDFRRLADDLQKQIELEEQRSGIKDPNHFAYSTFAKAALRRRENLISSIADLDSKLAEARNQLADAILELNKAELAAAGERPADRSNPTAPATSLLPVNVLEPGYKLMG